MTNSTHGQAGRGSPAAGRRPTGARLAAVTAAVVLALLVAEAGLRWLAPVPWYRVDEERDIRPAPVRAAGTIREAVRQPLTTAPPAGSHRTLVLGDSFTFGHGVTDDADTFVRRLEADLNARPPGEAFDQHVLFNGGISGSLTRHWVDLHDGVVPVLRPQLVLAVFFLRDGQGSGGTIDAFDSIRQELRDLERTSPLFRHSALYRSLRGAAVRRQLAREAMQRMTAGYVGTAEETREWRRAQLNLLRLRDESAARGGAFGVVIFPVLVGLDDDYPLQPVVDEIARFAADHDVPVHDLTPAFLGRDAESLWVSPVDQHANEEGQRIAAESMAPFVRRLVVASSAQRPAPAPPPVAAIAPPPIANVDAVLRARELVAELARAGGDPAALARVSASVRSSWRDVLLALREPDETGAAFQLVASMGPGGAQAMPTLLDVLEGPDLLARRRAEWAVRRLGSAATPAVDSALAAGGRRAVTAARAVRAMRPTAAEVPRLAHGLSLLLATGRCREAALAVGRLGPPAADAIRPLLGRPDAAARRCAAEALGHAGPGLDVVSVRALARALDDPASEVREAAARALWQVAPASAAVRTELEENAARSDGAGTWCALALREVGRGR